MTEERYVQRLGTTDETRNGRRGYVVVEVTLSVQAGEHVTTEHGTIVDPMRLSVMASQYAPYDRKDDPSRSGQARESLAEVTEPAPGWTLAEIAELGEIWDRWHLNDMRAACAHMDTTIPTDAHLEERYGRPDEQGWLLANVTCPETGYRYGHAWLTEEIPADVVERVRHLMRSRSNELYAARGYDMHGKRIQS